MTTTVQKLTDIPTNGVPVPLISTSGVLLPVVEVERNGVAVKSDGVLTSTLALRFLADQFAEQDSGLKSTLTFDEYMDLLIQRPDLRIRNIATYTKDAIDYIDRVFGGQKTIRGLGKDLRDFRFTDLPWKSREVKSADRFRGHPQFWNDFYGKLDDYSRMANPNSMLIAHGPNASGKSCAFDSLFEALEYYSHTDEGALFTPRFIFDKNLSQMGFHGKKDQEPIQEQEIILSILADKNTIPFFLYDTHKRKQIIEMLIEEKRLPEDFKCKEFTLSFEQDEVSEKIMGVLNKLYKNKEGHPDMDAVLRHVQVVRWYFSHRGGKGLVLKQAAELPNTVRVPIMPETNWDLLPPAIVSGLSDIGLGSLQGEYPSANHGIHYSDDFGRDVSKHIGLGPELFRLRLIEKGDGSVVSPEQKVPRNVGFDVLQTASANDTVLTQLEIVDPDNWTAIRERLEFLRIEHERCFKYVEELLKDKLELYIPKESNRHISPNVINALSLWVTTTHLFPPANEKYYDGLPLEDGVKKKLISLVKKLSLLDKALLYQGVNLNTYRTEPGEYRFTTDDEKLLQDNAAYIVGEYDIGFGELNLKMYEGSVGLSHRIAERLMAKAARTNSSEAFTTSELFDVLEKACKKTFLFEAQRDQIVASLNGIDLQKVKKPQQWGDHSLFPTSEDLLKKVVAFMKRKISYDVAYATGFTRSPKDVENDLIRYYKAADELRRNPPSPDATVHPDKEADKLFVESIEQTLEIKSADVDRFRQDIGGKIAVWAMSYQWKTDNAAERKEIIYKNIPIILKECADKLAAAYIAEQKKGIENFVKDLKGYYSSDMNPDKIEEIQGIQKRKDILIAGIEGLKNLGYNDESIKKEVFFAF